MMERHVDVMRDLLTATEGLRVRLREWTIADKTLTHYCGVQGDDGLCGANKDEHGIRPITGINEYSHEFVSITERFGGSNG